MADTNFQNGTVVEADWLNDVNDLVYDIQTAGSATKAGALIPFDASLSYPEDSLAGAIKASAITPTMLGAVGDGITDDTAALQAWAASTSPRVGENKVFNVTGQIDVAPGYVNFGGMTIKATGGTFTNNSVVRVAGSLGAAQPALSVDVALNDLSLSFSANHSLAKDDVFIIFNPTAGSFNSTRTYYYAGEFNKVVSVTSATQIKMWGLSKDVYPKAAVSVYKLTACPVVWENLTVEAPSTGFIRPIEVSLGTYVRMRNIKAYGSNYVGISLDRCYDVDISATGIDVSDQAVFSKYGISIGNSQLVRIRGCTVNAVRHAINIGGDDFVGSVPNTDVRVSNCTLKNDSALCSVPCCDVHGNARDIVYESCTIQGGGSFNGTNVSYIDCDIYGVALSTGAVIVYGSEWLGGAAKVEGCRITALPGVNYAYGIVRGGTAAAAKYDTTLTVKNVEVDMGSTDTFTRCDIVTTAFKTNAHLSGITFLNAAVPLNILRMSGDGGASTGDFCVVEGITNAPTGSALLVKVNGYTVAKRRLQRQTGTLTVASPAAVTSTTAVTYRYTYDTPPHAWISGNTAFVDGAKPANYIVNGIGTSGMNAVFYNPQNVAYAGGNNVTMYWSVEINEI